MQSLGGEFVNVKMDELMARLGVTARYGQAYNLWSNGINERNHASCDTIIKEADGGEKVQLNDLLVKAASWTHNTNLNKLV